MALDLALRTYDQNRKRYKFTKDPLTGDVQFDETQMHAVLTSVVERRGGYWADANHGSRLFELRNMTSQTPSQAEAEVLDAVAPLEGLGLISDPTARATAGTSRGGTLGQLSVDMTWNTPGGAVKASV